MISAKAWLTGFVLLAAVSGAGALQGDTILWRDQRMDAKIHNLPLPEVLKSLASATGWRIYLEPGTVPPVSAQFERLGITQALPRLLGDLNFALLPLPNGGAQLYVYRTTSKGATLVILPEAGKEPLQPHDSKLGKELIVTLKPGSQESIEQLAQRLGAKIAGRLDGLNAYRLQFDSDESASHARAVLEKDDDVQSVDSNYLVQPPARLDPLPQSQVPPIALRPKIVPNGDYTVVALVDTAVAGSQPSLKDFLLPSVSVSDSVVPDQLTHGTAMAETILRALSLSPGSAEGTTVRILPIDVYGNNTATTTFDVARGIYAASQAGPTVINLSLGSDSNSPFLYQLIQDVARQGVLVIAAAGNQPVNTPIYPAAYPEVLAVTASDPQGHLAAYASRGDFVDLIAPGTAVVQFDNHAFLGTGTSYATAYISGFAAGLVADSSQSTSQVQTTIRERFGSGQITTAAP